MCPIQYHFCRITASPFTITHQLSEHSNVTSTATRNIEKYIEPDWTVAHLKERLELITGIPVAAQQLTLSTGTVIENVTATLDTFDLTNCTHLYVSDTRDKTTIEESNKIDDSYENSVHFQISDEAYAARPNTFAKWRDTHFEKTNNNVTLSKTNRARQKIYEKGICIGEKCIVQGSNETRNGRVRFIGQVEGLPEGIWIGVEYDAPVGKNDGSFQGIRYFTASENHGSFLRPDRIKMCSPSPSINTDSEEEI
ncbi:hypothetical protein PORY_002098 [Pneumocystis oryctolagi]|uniref:Uncharacterized protein n=1 Tax=Pneumocystis oryctolagi TaxID=42067 RepID=A0ACB7CBT5_9ASCO|nr:hypothetical protein PORY_002098 [Pneumocystis oryctolagi]